MTRDLKMVGVMWDGYVPRWDKKKHTITILEALVETAQRDCIAAEGISPGELHALRHALKIVKQANPSQWKRQRFMHVIWRKP